MHRPLPRFRAVSPASLALTALIALSAILATAPASAQRWQIEPSADVLAGTPLRLAVSGLAPGQRATLRSERAGRGWDGQPLRYRAEAQFVADGDGRIDLATAAPVAGAYAGADLQGLFWAAAPVPEPPLAEGPAEAWQLSLWIDGRLADQASLRVRAAADDLQATPAPGFDGAVLYRRPGAAQRPALIALGGSEGGGTVVAALARALASHGWAVLALPYHSPQRWGPQGPMAPELPSLPAAFAAIPVDRLQAARDWLAAQPGIDASRIGVYGVSKGAEFALLAAVRMPWIRSVVAVVPSDVGWEGWGPGTPPGESPSFSWQGRPLPFVPYRGMAEEMQGFGTGAEVRFRRPHDAGRAAAAPERVAAARIPVEDYAGPLLVIGGGDDQVWDSGGMAAAIAERRRAAGRETVALLYPQAGHALSGSGWRPTTGHNAGPMKLGGQPAADGRAVAEAWPRTLEFLRRTLGPLPD